MLNSRIISGFCIFFLFTFAVLVSCTQRDHYIGTYKIEGEASPGSEGDYILLRENGEGMWRVKNDEFAFGWDLKYDKLYLHTKGGVVIGKLKDGKVIEIALPGSRVMSFRKQ